MLYESTANLVISSIARLLRSVARELASNQPLNSRTQLDGCDLYGDYNFRTGRPDCGLDPSGIYEDDQ